VSWCASFLSFLSTRASWSFRSS
uniref:Uncharacterized protein n=1 Tax=Amphimedon queenslandica TaxID=400682 RepID=A0A1X7VP59_AMPQE